MKEIDLQRGISDNENPSATQLGGLDQILKFGPNLAADVYADRLVAALRTVQSHLPNSVVDLLVLIIERNSHPLVVSAAAQNAIYIELELSDQRTVQRSLLKRAAVFDEPLQAEMASECLAGAFLFAGLPGGSRPAVIAALDDIQINDPPILVRRASLIAGLAWLWHRSPDIERILQRLGEDPEAGEQARYELGIVALDNALHAFDRDTLLDGLNRARALFLSVLEIDPDMEEAEAFSQILSAILQFVAEDKNGIEEVIDAAISTAVARGNAIASNSLRHWLRPRIDLEFAWHGVALALRGLSAELDKSSWLRAVLVLEQISRLRRAVVSAATEDGDQLRSALTARLADSFLRHEGLKAHLQEWATDTAISESDRHQAEALLTALEERQKSGNLAGLAGNDTSTSPDTEKTLAQLEALSDLAQGSGFNRITEELFLEIDKILSAHPDYVAQTRKDSRILLKYLILFLGHCLDVTPAMAVGTFDFLFERDGSLPLEKELQRTCWNFLRLQTDAFPQHQIVRELPDVATGRADIAVVRPDWRMVLEVKREVADCSRNGIRKYLGQAANYELTGPRIGFLIVLDLQSQKAWPLTMRDNFWVEEVRGEEDSVSRLICVCRIPGARKAPSETKTPFPHDQVSGGAAKVEHVTSTS